MENIRITQRQLRNEEIYALMDAVSNASDIVYVAFHRWKELPKSYVVENDGEFAGACGVYVYENWIKIGPLVVIPTHRGKGLAKMLLTQIMRDHRNTNMLILSSNPIVQHMVRKRGFISFKPLTTVPFYTLIRLFAQLVGYAADIRFLKEWLRKRSTHTRGPIMFYTYKT